MKAGFKNKIENKLRHRIYIYIIIDDSSIVFEKSRENNTLQRHSSKPRQITICTKQQAGSKQKEKRKACIKITPHSEELTSKNTFTTQQCIKKAICHIQAKYNLTKKTTLCFNHKHGP